MAEVTTKSGFTIDIDEKKLDDMLLLEVIAEADGGNPLEISKAISMLLGDRKNDLYDYLKTEDGRVPIGKVSEELIDIIASLGDKGKK
ncbi:MAG: hypothetical protein RSA49_05225 [Anaerovoracaceae bacterium]